MGGSGGGDGARVKNTATNEKTITAGCDCGVCTGTPFESGIGTYTIDDLNAMFQGLIGEATSPAVAKKKNLSPTKEKHEQEAFALSSVIFNRAAADKKLIDEKKPSKWGYNSNGTPLGVMEKSQVVAYTSKAYETHLKDASRLGWLKKGTEYCEWLEVIKAQIENAAKNPTARKAYVGWRARKEGRKDAVTILNTDFLMTP